MLVKHTCRYTTPTHMHVYDNFAPFVFVLQGNLFWKKHAEECSDNVQTVEYLWKTLFELWNICGKQKYNSNQNQSHSLMRCGLIKYPVSLRTEKQLLVLF